MDLNLVIIIGGAVVFGGAVAYLVLLRERGAQRAALAAVGVAAVLAASFLLMLLLARLALPAVLVFVALFSGAVTHLVFRRELGARRAALLAAGATIVITVSALFVLYLAVIAFILAIGVYLLLRIRLRLAPALVLMGGTLGGLLAASAGAFWISLTYM
ncbi:hypothetical protein [Micromonospora parathelypteridis]|uniref:Uncharacterized membrane protein (UPF0182 family) n=1 Tax=Micromonospora parathelypteridis TaxID=1839617 RepID=A0A840VXJ7_9ACTN|nr:hypothetical protein [Micromonospora parathelypteridis]MBB5475761.1 uncharacterized membrane protein (UPF0182 family) [Micromonospora parathelypteridis]GGO26684.1 hypothetical protein GCM10011576_50560 [Micromonospora parathelypteridis]